MSKILVYVKNDDLQCTLNESIALRAVERVDFLSHLFLIQLRMSGESYIWSEYCRLYENEQKEC